MFNIKAISILLSIVFVFHFRETTVMAKENLILQSNIPWLEVESSCNSNDCEAFKAISISFRKSVMMLTHVQGDCRSLNLDGQQKNSLLENPVSEFMDLKYTYLRVNYSYLGGQKINLICAFKK